METNKMSLQQFMLKRELPEKETLPVVMLSSETTATKAETRGEM